MKYTHENNKIWLNKYYLFFSTTNKAGPPVQHRDLPASIELMCYPLLHHQQKIFTPLGNIISKYTNLSHPDFHHKTIHK